MSDLLPPIPDLPAELKGRLDQLPLERLTTPGDLARSLGDVRAARWVAQEAKRLQKSAGHPAAWRVVTQAGAPVGGDEQTAHLVENDFPPDTWRSFLWNDFAGPAVLEPLRAAQLEVARLRREEPLPDPLRHVGGVDLSYPTPTEAAAAYVVCDAATGAVVDSLVVRSPVRFPYISGYLGYRELPALLALWDAVGTSGLPVAEVVLVDGSGLLHPLRAGIAVHFGVAIDHPTVAVAKRKLCGTIDAAPDPGLAAPLVRQGGETLGAVVSRHAGSAHPLFVSPGHRVALADAVAIVRGQLTEHRLPEPTFHADAISRAAGKG